MVGSISFFCTSAGWFVFLSRSVGCCYYIQRFRKGSLIFFGAGKMKLAIKDRRGLDTRPKRLVWSLQYTFPGTHYDIFGFCGTCLNLLILRAIGAPVGYVSYVLYRYTYSRANTESWRRRSVEASGVGWCLSVVCLVGLLVGLCRTGHLP